MPPNARSRAELDADNMAHPRQIAMSAKYCGLREYAYRPSVFRVSTSPLIAANPIAITPRQTTTLPSKISPRPMLQRTEPGQLSSFHSMRPTTKHAAYTIAVAAHARILIPIEALWGGHTRLSGKIMDQTSAMKR